MTVSWPLINSVLLGIVFLLFVFLIRKQNQTIQQSASSYKEKLSRLQQELLVTQQSLSTAEIQAAKQNTQLKELAQLIERLSSKQAQQNNELAQLPELNSEIAKIHNLLQLIQSESSEQKLYGRAKKMIELGADVEELMTECEIPRGEAELLLSLHN